MNFKIPNLAIDEDFKVTGIAKTSNPESVKTRFDSERNFERGLKCCADSNAKTLSTELSAKGNPVEEELMVSICDCLPE